MKLYGYVNISNASTDEIVEMGIEGKIEWFDSMKSLIEYQIEVGETNGTIITADILEIGSLSTTVKYVPNKDSKKTNKR